MKIWLTVISTTLGFLLAINISYTNGFTQKDHSNSYSLLHARSVDINNAKDLKHPHNEINSNVQFSKRHKTNDNEPSQKNHRKSKIASKDPQYEYDTDNDEASPASDAMKVVDNDTGQIDESNLKSGLSASKRAYDTDDYNPELSEQTIGALHENTIEDESAPTRAIDGPFEEENYKGETRPEGDPYESIPFTHDGGISPATSLDDNHVSATSRHTEHAVPFLTEASPSPSACLVHVPVTIHLKGTLAIRMKNCANCGDFTKNIESIGPLKVAPLNNDNNNNPGIHQAEYSPQYEAEVRSTFHHKEHNNDLQSPTKYNEGISNILNYLAESDSIDFDKYMLEKDNSKIEGKLEAEIPRFVSDTKKDTAARVSGSEKHETVRINDNDDKQPKKKHIILDKHIVLPSILIPADAYKKGVIVSLPKGKAVLKCVSKKKDVGNYATKPQSNRLPAKLVKTKSDDNSSGLTSNDLNESNLQKAIVGELKNHVKPVPIPQKVNTAKGEVERFTAGELLHHFHNNDKLTEKFMKLFDKDMIVSLYRIAVNDIKGEMNRVSHKSMDDRVVRKKMELLGNERPILERRFPGFQDALDEEVDLEPLRYSKKRKRSNLFWNAGSRNLIRKRRFKLGSYTERSLVPEETSERSNQLKPQKIKTSRGTRRVKLVDTYRPLRTEKSNSKLNTKTWSEVHPKKDEEALSFYGEVDPNKLADPNCMEELCEKQKQFISHAGQYFQSLDNLAMEPYKDFLDDKGKPTQEGHPVTVKLGDGESPNSANVRRSVKLGVRIRQPEDVHTTSRKTVIEHNDDFDKERTRKTLVELYGTLPRIPLKITLNPKGPLAKLKKRIEIDLRPPNKGEPSSKAIVKTNDPKIGIHIANQLFIDDPPDKGMKTRLKKGDHQTKRDQVVRAHTRKKPKRKRRKCRKKKRRKILKQGAFQKNNVLQTKVYRRHETKGDNDEIHEGSFVQEDEGEKSDEMSNKHDLTEESCFDEKSAENETNSIKPSDVEIDDKITCENETNTRDETSSYTFEPRHPPLCIPSDSALFKINANDDPVKHLINTSTVTQDPDNMVHLCSIGSNEEYLNSSYCTRLLQNRASINSNRYRMKDKKSYKKSHQTKVLNAQISSTKNAHSGKHYTKVRKISIKFMINELKPKKGKTNKTMKLSSSMPQPTKTSLIISPFTAHSIDPYSLKLPLDSAIIKHPIKDDPVQKIVNLSQGKNTRNSNLVAICNEYELNNKNRKNDSFTCNKTDENNKNETVDLTAVKKDDNRTMNNTEVKKDVNVNDTETLNLAAAKKDDNGTIDKVGVDNDANETETLSLATTETNINGTMNNAEEKTKVNETGTLSFAYAKKDDNGTMKKEEVDKHVNETETSSFGTAKEDNNKTTIKALVNKNVTNAAITNSSADNKSLNASTSKRFGVNNEIDATSNVKNVLNVTDLSVTSPPNSTNITNAYSISNNTENAILNKQSYKDYKDNKLIKIEIASDDWGKFAGKPNNQTKGKSDEPNKLTINIKTKRKKDEMKKKEGSTFFVSVDATKQNKKDTFDPYTDLGAEARRSEVEDSSNDTLLQRYLAATIDPYSTLGSLLESSKTNDHSKGVLSKRIEISGKTKKHSLQRHKKQKSIEKPYKKYDIDRSPSPSGVGAISLIRHTVSDIMKSYAEDKLSKQKDTNIEDRHEDNANARIVSDPNIKLDTDKPLSDTDKSAMLAAFPQFKEELSKISPETKKRLFMLKPFKFLSPLANKNESLEEEQPLHDPYADMGQVVEPKSRILSHENLRPSIRKEYRPVRRSEPYDPYADMGTSIGLSQNEARAKIYDSNATFNENATSTETLNQENNTTGKIIQIEANIQVYDYNTTSNETQGKVTTEGQVQKKSHQVPEAEKAEKKIRKNGTIASDEALIIRDAVQSSIEKPSNAVATTEEKGMNNLTSVAMNNGFFPKSSIQLVETAAEPEQQYENNPGKKGKVHSLSHLIIESEPIMKEDFEGSDSDLIVSKFHNDLDDRSTVSNGEMHLEKKEKYHVSKINDSKLDANANINFFVTNEFMSAPEKNNIEVLQGNAGKEIINHVGDAENEKGTILLKKDGVSSNGKMIRNESNNSVKKDIVSFHSKRPKSVPSDVHSKIIHLDKKENIQGSAFVREMKDLGDLLHQKMNHIQNPSHIVYYSNSGYMIKEVPKDGDVAERKMEDVSPKAYKCYQINTNKIIELMNEHYKRMGHTGNIWADPKEVGGNPESNTVKLCKRIPPTPTIENNNTLSINAKNETALKDLKETTLNGLKETTSKNLEKEMTNTSTEKFKSPNDYMDDPYMQIGATVDQGTKKSVLLSPILLRELQKSQTQKKADLEKIADKMKSDRQFKDEVIGFIFEQLAKEEKEKKELEALNSPRPIFEGEKTPLSVQQNNTLTPNKTENFTRDPYAELGTLIDVPNKKSMLSKIPQNEKRETNAVSKHDPYLDIGSSIKKDTFSLHHSVTENAEKRRIP